MQFNEFDAQAEVAESIDKSDTTARYLRQKLLDDLNPPERKLLEEQLGEIERIRTLKVQLFSLTKRLGVCIDEHGVASLMKR